MSAAAAPPPGAAPEVAFISGVTSSNQVAATSFWTWNGNTNPATYSAYILAAQQLYGAATSGPLAGGGQVFGFNSNIGGLISNYFDFTVNTHPVITIWDGGSNNTLDLSGWSTPATINLNPGTFSSANGEGNNIGIAAGTIIQTAIRRGGNRTVHV